MWGSSDGRSADAGYGSRVRSSSRPVVLLALVAALTGACGGGPDSAATPTPDVDESAEQLQRLRTAVERVAESQATADAALFGVLDLVRAIDGAVPGMLDAETIDDTITAWKSSGALMHVPQEAPDLRAGYLAVAGEVDDARTALVAARRQLQDPWERRYLDAEDRVLTAVREYAEAGDRLAQILQRNWDTYVWFHTAMESFVERRWQFRSKQEAADAFFVETDTRLDLLATAQRQISGVRTEREQAATTVNTASGQAQDVWAARPSERATASEDTSAP